MQFVTNGPDIPEALLQAHEDSRVVFFCGAGISYPAGLPGFKGLVDEIYRRIGTEPTEIEQDAYKRNQFDATLDLLERRIPGQRIGVRKVLADALQPNLKRKKAIDTHAALLHLARNRKGIFRLVTTNFDRIFEKVAKRIKQPINSFVAPMLPIPKNSRWNGLVYLHGQLPEELDETALQRLVLTSGDFGLAYLTERWAARFVSELFRNYVVCFVGYSINDPVLRYMMDALAADRMLGESTPQAYALGDCEPGQEHYKTIEWKAKGVIPILYEVSKDNYDHSILHSTLKKWSDTYRDGILGKERIVMEYGIAHPSASTQQDDFVGRMLWALSHKSGLPAKCFAEFNPVPPIEWLKVFSEDRYRHSDLDRFGILPHPRIDESLHFSFIRRPAPYAYASYMSLAPEIADIRWDDVMSQLARWLVRHLNDPELIFWLAQRGGQLHNEWRRLIEGKLDFFARLEREGKTAELDEIRTNAPNAIPQPPMRILWRLLLTGRVKSWGRDWEFYSWKGRLQRDGLTAMSRFELRELLSPKVVLKRPSRWGEDGENDNDVAEPPQRLKQLVDWELVLTTDHIHSALEGLKQVEHWGEVLPRLLGDFQQLLSDALDLLRELSEVDDLNDPSYWYLPSISPHWQNREYHEWVALIELLRDAWLATKEIDPNKATWVAQVWFDFPYPTFKRLALFAASQDGCISPERWLEWLNVDGANWLWATDTHREVMRLLVLQGYRLSQEASTKLENAILAGPPRENFQDDIEPEWWQSHVDYSIWLRFAKLRAGGSNLSTTALSHFAELSKKNPRWKLSDDERDEFTHWMSGTGDPDYEESRDIDFAPQNRRELVKWLKRPPAERRPFYEDTWQKTCRDRLSLSLVALCELAQEKIWMPGRWREALQAWSEDGLILRSWRYAAPLVQTMPDYVLLEIVPSVARWLEKVSKIVDRHEDILLDICRRVLELPLEPDSSIMMDGKSINQPVFEAINHSVGHVTQVLLNLWLKRKLNDRDTLPADLKPFFTRLCDTNIGQFRHGRVLLASQLITFFRVDRPWTEQNLLPLFDWTTNSVEARAAWEGFLWSPRLYQPLLIVFKSQFLKTAHHYAELGEHSRQFAVFLTYAALHQVEGYTLQDFRLAVDNLPNDGLQEIVKALSQALEGAGEQREDYWKNRIQPFLIQVWPKSHELGSNEISKSFVRLSIAARDEFPAALSLILNWLQPFEHPHHVLHSLRESGLCSRFPVEALQLLDKIIDQQPWISSELEHCLEAISRVSPVLNNDYRYLRLSEHARRYGG